MKQQTQVIKPTEEELLTSFTKMMLPNNNERFDVQSNWFAMRDMNENALSGVTQPDYNQDNFNSLIAAIELNGITSFNMNTFMGVIKKDSEEYYDGLPVHQCTVNHITGNSKPIKLFDASTNAFNCDSVGCIAGFATALSMDWYQPSWLKGDTRDFSIFFEAITCNWLNIPIAVGKTIFYGDEGSVWSFLKFFEPHNYSGMQWLNGYGDDEDYNGSDSDYQDYWTELEVSLTSIDYKTASDVLRRIADGTILINMSREIKYAKKGQR